MKGVFAKSVFFFRYRIVFRLFGVIRTQYFRLLGMSIGKGSLLPKIYVSWPHQVSIGNSCTIEHGVYFHFDGIFAPGPRICIADDVFIGASCEFNVQDRLNIGRGASIAAGCRFVDHNHNISGQGPFSMPDLASPIDVQEHAWIGANVTVLMGVTIGAGAVVGAGSVVKKSIPRNEIWAGVPAKRIGTR